MSDSTLKSKYERIKPFLIKTLTSTAQGYIFGATMGVFIPRNGKRITDVVHETGTTFMKMGFLYSGTECIVKSIRKKNDLYNGMIAGAVAGGALSYKYGFKSAIIGSTTFSLYSGISEYYNHNDINL
ncbi:Mitochondrial import inner membrane translocase subunit TIM22 [Astathelohania contejeani]|uniref:Mitochondrial import inner membrane translocase subunit TIM22 n=1 Tax=Astathelohania contejeani TaxID=164912 RepID=A0ABQ7HWI8_9MICR|nr:Mitochondrial import inner membrane translocase subunit TIM22 [Thelohania contejeani]